MMEVIITIRQKQEIKAQTIRWNIPIDVIGHCDDDNGVEQVGGVTALPQTRQQALHFE